MDPFDPPPQAHHKVDSDGETFIWQVRPGLVIEKGRGLLTLSLAHCFTEYMSAIDAPLMRWTLFGDFERLEGYTREAREHLSAFSVARITHLSAIHFLVSSKFVALGLSSYRDDIGEERFRIYTDRASFLRSFADALQTPS